MYSEINKNLARLRKIALSVTTFCLLLSSASIHAEIEEMFVTAQKRSENLQEVPIAITALSSDAIIDRGIKNIEGLISSAPGITGYEAPSTRGNIGFSVRGIGSGNPNNISIDPANAIYIDGVYLGKATGLGVDSGDLERIEILRGPQGTLYGRNSTGGALNFITRKPAGETGGDVTVTTGSDGLLEYRGRFDFAASDQFGAAISYRSRERDDLYTNTNPDSEGFENLDRSVLRLSANWSPTDNLNANYVFDQSEIDNENTQALKVFGLNPLGAGVLAAPGFPDNVSTNSQDRVAALTQTQQFLPFLGPAFFAPEVQQLDQWITDYLAWAANGYNQGARENTARRSYGSADSPHFSSNEVQGHSLTFALDKPDMGAFGDVEFKSITGIREVNNLNNADLDGIDNTLRSLGGGLTTGVVSDLTLLTIGGLFFDSVGGPLIPAGTEFATGQSIVNAMNARGRAETFNTFITADYEQFTQELQMVGATSNLEYALGLFYLSDEGQRGGQSTALFPISSTTSNAYENGTTSTSVYAQGTWTPASNDKLDITAGLRHTKEDKEITYLYRASTDPSGFFGPIFAGQSPAVTYVDNADASTQPEVAGIFGRHFEKDFSNTSGKFTAAYQFTDNVNAYASYSTGFRSGGYNGESFNTAEDTADQFDEENIDNIELGIKTDLMDNRLRINAAYFDYSYDNIQVSTLEALPDGSVTSKTANAGAAERNGFELEVTVTPIDNLLLSVNYSAIDGEFTQYPPIIAPLAGGGAVLETTDIAEPAGVESQLAFNIDYTILERSFGNVQFNMNGIWQEAAQPIALNSATYDTNGDGINDTPVIFEQALNDERTLLNTRLALNDISAGNGTLNIGLWSRNLLDDDHRQFSFNYGAALGLNVSQAGEPRMTGIDFNYKW